MTKEIPIDVRLRPELSDRVAAIAASLDRPSSWVVEQAVEPYVDFQRWRVAAIGEGIKAADEGRVVSHATVASLVASWDAPDELPMPTCD